MLSKAKRTPIKHSVALRAVCAKHGVTVEGSNLMVCQGRKVVYVLRVGVLHSKNCIVKEAPTPSFRRDSGVAESGWKTVAVPKGWKVAVIVDNDVWTAEIGYSKERDLPQYQFTRMDENGEIMVQSEWCFTPSGAFKSASAEYIGDENAWGRHNGKLYLGCTYDYPQVFLRQYFKKKLDANDHDWDETLKALIVDWLDPTKQSPKAVFNIENKVGPDSYAAKESATDHGVSLRDHSGAPRLTSAGGSGDGTLAETESDRSDTDQKTSSSSNSAGAVTHHRKKRKTSSMSESSEEQQSPLQKRLEAVTTMWMNRVWPDISPDIFAMEAKLRRAIPGNNAHASAEAQQRAFASDPGSFLSEEEILAIVSHVDGQTNRIALEKQVRFPMAGSGAAAPMPTYKPALGFVPENALKNIMNLVPNKKEENGVVKVKMDEFLQRLDNLETTAEYLFPVLSSTLFLFPVEDVFKRVEEGNPQVSKENLTFIRNRMRELDVDSKDKFSLFSNSSEFIRALTYLPRSSFIQKFVGALQFMAPTSMTILNPTNMMSMAGGNQAMYGSFPSLIAASWMTARGALPTGSTDQRPFISMPVMYPPSAMRPTPTGVQPWMAPPAFIGTMGALR